MTMNQEIQATSPTMLKRQTSKTSRRTVITGISGWLHTRDFSGFPQCHRDVLLLNSEGTYFVYVSTCMEGTVGLTSGWWTVTVCTLRWSGAGRGGG